MDVIHFLIGDTKTLCGDSRLGLTVSSDREKVTCPECQNALSVTVLVTKPKKEEPPPVAPVVDDTE